ncbi:MazG nucleotide pyrophosphohydrolase domain-containing protein [Actinoplanes sp. NBRC 103695]|uniref:MazG nucleotide pyrophosphohydrolase domain-containing protein n=1 Tax=Actinoplanes sp. NBRC 103695 TaxID=3032202 RepID=UPI0024A2B1FE|nr:MazG nucleotide pyrophosphohydrolase domain-containing protein [Actinoplanes sp. NBRC 103695]GLY98096.1 pyrophosphatase [Actinoplanes sp. NBRC 103695]
MELRRLSEDVAIISDRYAEVHAIDRTDAWYLLKLQEEVGELTQAFLRRNGQARTKGLDAEAIEAGFRAELADVLCQLLLMARHHGVDIEDEVRRKWLYRLPGITSPDS